MGLEIQYFVSNNLFERTVTRWVPRGTPSIRRVAARPHKNDGRIRADLYDSDVDDTEEPVGAEIELVDRVVNG